MGTFRSVATATAIVALAGCGVSPASKVTAFAKAERHAKSATCAKAGIMVFVGKRETVYGCRLTGVPPARRPLAQLDSPAIRLCFVETDGSLYDVACLNE